MLNRNEMHFMKHIYMLLALNGDFCIPAAWHQDVSSAATVTVALQDCIQQDASLPTASYPKLLMITKACMLMTFWVRAMLLEFHWLALPVEQAHVC
jgi:hypothetical protein